MCPTMAPRGHGLLPWLIRRNYSPVPITEHWALIFAIAVAPMPVINITKQAALGLLQKWTSEKTSLKIIFGLTDKTNAPESDGRLFTLNAAVIVGKAGSSTLLLEQVDSGSITA